MAEDSIISFVYQGSFKGVPIKIDGGTTAGGRKIVKHEFPNRDEQTIEDLGLKPRRYDLSLIVSSNTPSGYFSQKNALLELLEQPGAGILVHPFYGKIENVVATEWNIREESGSLGEAVIEVTFEIDEGTGIPVEAQLSLTDLQKTLSNVVAVQTAEFKKSFKVSKSVFGNALSALKKGTAFAGKISSAAKAASNPNSTLVDFTNELNAFQANLKTLVLNPSDYIDSINNLFSAVDNLFDNPKDSLKSFQGMFGFGATDTKFTRVASPANIERERNDNLMNTVMNTSALSGAYMASAQLDYSTVDEIDTVVEQLDAQFQDIVSNPETPFPIVKALTEARVVVQEFYDDKRIRAAELVPITISTTPARLLSYQYYGSSERGEEISLLNSQPDVSFIAGDINVLSE